MRIISLLPALKPLVAVLGYQPIIPLLSPLAKKPMVAVIGYQP